ncbi:MAG TPA: hypothetical protein VFR88_12890 [Microlunatus sp.]|nr:hypothetical protein [Microlunatus sp.]
MTSTAVGAPVITDGAPTRPATWVVDHRSDLPEACRAGARLSCGGPMTRTPKIIAAPLLIAGVIVVVAGIATWVVIIEHHAMTATGGKTYAELAQDDPLRVTAMNASFLRASLSTSVVAYGVAAFAVGIGVVLGLLAVATRALDHPVVPEQ